MSASRWRCAFTGPRIITPTTVLEDHGLLVSDGRIEAVCPRGQLPGDVPVTEIEGTYLAPGFVDIHVHGAAGRGYNEGTADAVTEIGAALLAAGVTTALPTLASARIDDLVRALRVIAAAGGTGKPDTARGPWLPGAHLEGPYFSPEQAGAQDPRALRVPSDGSLGRLLQHAEAITMMSFAPELEGAVHLTEQLLEAGVVAAAGHTNGTMEDLEACQRAGLSHVIHVFSGQSTTTRHGPWRVPGMLEATLASDGLTVEMIADGKHLPPLLMRLAHRALGDRLCLVSDASPGAGMPDASGYRMGEVTYVVEDGVGVTQDRTAFGGSTTMLSGMLPIAQEALALPLPELVAMVSAVPARAARLTDVGRLEAGYWADIVLLDDALVPRAVAQRGRWNDAMTKGTSR